MAATTPTWNPEIARRCAVPVPRRTSHTRGSTPRRSPRATAARTPRLPTSTDGGSVGPPSGRATRACTSLRTPTRRAESAGCGPPSPIRGGGYARPRTTQLDPIAGTSGNRTRTRPRHGRKGAPPSAHAHTARSARRPCGAATTRPWSATGPSSTGPGGTLLATSRPSTNATPGSATRCTAASSSAIRNPTNSDGSANRGDQASASKKGTTNGRMGCTRARPATRGPTGRAPDQRALRGFILQTDRPPSVSGHPGGTGTRGSGSRRGPARRSARRGRPRSPPDRRP